MLRLRPTSLMSMKSVRQFGMLLRYLALLWVLAAVSTGALLAQTCSVLCAPLLATGLNATQANHACCSHSGSTSRTLQRSSCMQDADSGAVEAPGAACQHGVNDWSKPGRVRCAGVSYRRLLLDSSIGLARRLVPHLHHGVSTAAPRSISACPSPYLELRDVSSSFGRAAACCLPRSNAG